MQSPWPRITIVTPSFNQGEYIEQTILSIIEQDYPNLQYIVMDGGSTDDTVAILEKYSDRIDYWVSEKDNGQSHAINKGLAMADGDVFNWINSDDWLEPRALHTIAELFRKHDALAVGTRCNLLQSGKTLRIMRPTKKHTSWIESAWETGLNQQGLYFKTSCLKQMHGVDESYNYSMDLDLWTRFLLTFGQDNYVTSNVITANFRLHDNCKSGEGWGPGSPSDVETKAMRFRLAKLLNDERYFSALKFLFPDYKKELAEIPISNELPKERVGEWLNRGLFYQMKKAYYAEDFERAAAIGLGIDPTFLKENDEDDFKAFLRYSKLSSSMFGKAFKKLLNR